MQVVQNRFDALCKGDTLFVLVESPLIFGIEEGNVSGRLTSRSAVLNGGAALRYAEVSDGFPCFEVSHRAALRTGAAGMASGINLWNIKVHECPLP